MYYFFIQQYIAELSIGLGLIIGSFINVFTYRYPIILKNSLYEQVSTSCTMEYSEKKSFNLLLPGSHCPLCGDRVRWYDNIPVVSWILLGGACRKCKGNISIRYPAIEIITALSFFLCALMCETTPWGLAMMTYSALSIAASIIDIDNQWLPDCLTQPILWLGIIFAWSDVSPLSLHDSITGAIVGFSSFWLLAWTTKKLIGKEAMGMGDVILFSAVGAWVGPASLIYVSLFASIGGLFYCLIFKKIKEQIPFGPWLCVSGWIVMLLRENDQLFIVHNTALLY